VLLVAGRPDLTFTSLTLPISMFPFISQRLTKGLKSCGWSNRLTRDQTCQWKPTYKIASSSTKLSGINHTHVV
jgi:hypothetical protein